MINRIRLGAGRFADFSLISRKEIIRAEMLGPERLEEQARLLALNQPVSVVTGKSRSLSDRINENYRVLVRANETLLRAHANDQTITPAAQWLIDNFHVIQSQIRDIAVDLPPGYYRQLPKLATGDLAGYPRVFGISWNYIAHVDSNVERDTLQRFIRAYQQIQPLSIGELWAVAITLRIVLVENLRRAADQVVENRGQREEANRLADAILGGQSPRPGSIPDVQERIRAGALLPTFSVQLIKRLRDQPPVYAPALLWLEESLAEHGTTADDVVRQVHQRQAALTVTVRNIVTAMRTISSVDWTELFEGMSLVGQIMNEDGAFEQMDFATRDAYRKAIEELAAGAGLAELDVSRQVARDARDARTDTTLDPLTRARRGDAGFYLLGSGRTAFEAAIGYRPAPRKLAMRLFRAGGFFGQSMTTAVFTLVLVFIAVHALMNEGMGVGALIGFAILALFPAMDAASALTNTLITSSLTPTVIPGLHLKDGVPDPCRTMVVIPTMLTSEAAVAELLSRLEIHYLSSLTGSIYYALLTDWTDCKEENAPGDMALVAQAREGIAGLNREYGPAGEHPRFFLLHRRRVWNPSEGRWIGWERKRGKLHELNRLLRGATDTHFLGGDGLSPEVPEGVRFVITLDSDTQLPRDAVAKLIGKMAHPLNQPTFDASGTRVIEGYGILQPRVTPSLPLGSEPSVYQYAFSTPAGVDPYVSAISEVYQDLYGEGSYAGKGIYDIDAFETALANRIPENTLLSHDLFEGVFARSGFASDVEVIEEFPARHDVSASRQHRWTRGDWQLLPWILGRRDSGIPAVGRWKMLDNLRRSLTPPFLIVAFLAGFALPFYPALWWIRFLLLLIVLPLIPSLLVSAVPTRRDLPLTAHFRGVWADILRAASHFGLTLALVAEQASQMADAILRTLVRLYGTHRHMLEWTTAAQAGASAAGDVGNYYRRMPGTVAVGVVALLIGLTGAPHVFWLALPFGLMWLAAPAIAWWASQTPPAAEKTAIAADDALALRLIARQTWRFFEAYVTKEDNFLPPDNIQEDPRLVVAHRTSPTNIGLYLLSVAAARDFGWIGLHEAADRLEATLSTLDRLERMNGHFYNWYDTTDLRALPPTYISSVDSGNLAGHFIALANTCHEWVATPACTPQAWEGLRDTVTLARRALLRAGTKGEQTSALMRVFDGMDRHLDHPRATAEWMRLFTELGDRAVTASCALDDADPTPGHKDVREWAQSPRRAMESQARDMRLLPADAAQEAEWHRSESLLDLIRADTAQAPCGVGRKTDAAALYKRLMDIASRAMLYAQETRFDFLVDPDRHLLSIGYRCADNRLDQSSYDLLASEARLASFLAIARGDLPASHWFRLGRRTTPVHRGAALISWSGSMFEYLMPSLVMRAPTGSILATTNRLVVARQIDYAAALGVPWGMSESAYNVRDFEMTYQYSNFGIPDLALKRGLGESAVIAPYATGLAAMVDPQAALRNFDRLTAAGALGKYGFYEALDYTPSRIPSGERVAIVRSHMAHHQGMTLVAILNALRDGVMRTRFHTDARVRATELLLHERAPANSGEPGERTEFRAETSNRSELDFSVSRRVTSPHGAVPATHVLSNGRYGVMVTGAGAGFSRWRGRAITRWREDLTADDWGWFIYLRDARTDAVWSAGYQPVGREADHYTVTFAEERAEFIRRDGSLTTTMEIVVSAEDDAEVRRVTLTNSGTEDREIELTSYMELALAPPTDDNAHPAFSKMFVQTEYRADLRAVLAWRRKRSPSEMGICAAHLIVVEGETVGDLHHETDRAAFLGRGRNARDPAAVMTGQPLTGKSGTVLDPVFSLRQRVRVAPGVTVRVAFWTLVAEDMETLLHLIDSHHDRAAYDRAVTLAWTQARVQMHHLGIGSVQANNYQRLTSHLLYVNNTLRPTANVIARGAAGQSSLWAQGISGDLPIVLAQIDDIEDIAMVRELVLAHEYWRMKQLAIDLVILNDKEASYNQDLQVAIDEAVRMGQTRLALAGENVRGHVYVSRRDAIGPEARDLLFSVARVVLISRRGPLADQLDRLEEGRAIAPPSQKPRQTPVAEAATPPPPDLEFFNDWGGFAEEGREYVIVLDQGHMTPAPWTNVIANESFGFHVTAEGGGYTWWRNSRENQLTPWANDPVSDRPGDIVYIRDEESGDLWGPTALPVRLSGARHQVHHGMGYSRFQTSAFGIASDLLQFVPLDDAVRISRLTLKNTSGRARRLSVTRYVEWVLGPSRLDALTCLITEVDPGTGAIMARNPWNTAFGTYTAFLAMPGRETRVTGDRREFLGRNGAVAAPAALSGNEPLSGRAGAGLDPCGAIQTRIDLAPGQTVEIVLLLGVGDTQAHAVELIGKYQAGALDGVLAKVRDFWSGVTGGIQVATPDRTFDIMLNHWLLYQTLACRVWARSGMYQASGAYGFRDQLQDGMALTGTMPALTRSHLPRAAARQFIEGDVQHWWLPHSGQGIRTRISDDRIWLAYAVHHYLTVSGDHAILDEAVPFLEGPELQPHEHEAYYLPTVSPVTASLFEHCALGLDHALATGPRGLPLIGTGDWNDGMSRVGIDGTGESVWLGWFLYATLLEFAPVAEARGERERAATWRAHAEKLRLSLEENAWDGAWYRRGYFDDGTPLGSATASECRIDSIAQSWSVLSGAADPNRAARAMAALDEHLIKRHDGIALLLTPPFDHTPTDPGYIKGYPPGLRENGGQYTHAAIWAIAAFARLGDGDKATGLFWTLNPINHARDTAAAYRYKVEPYVLAADIYSAPGHVGRGGWTWYTGSAGWMYRAGTEFILGLRRRGDVLEIDPCVPKGWPGFKARVRHGATYYDVEVDNGAHVSTGVREARLDGEDVIARPVRVAMRDDGKAHTISLTMG